jgi:ubiquinone/menaquinone biosynthesis C-methylase UbiE
MSIFHYFSNDSNQRAQFIFNTIAPIYAKVDKTLQSNYSKSIDLLKNEITIKDKSVLDIGTGTGAWAMMFLNNKADVVHGIDFSEKMLEVSKKKHPKIHFSTGNAENLSDIDDGSFDIVTASYVVHGVKADKRAKMINEMQRIAKEVIVIHDFVGKTPIFIRFLEFMEQSDYKNFKKNFCEELKNITGWQTKKITSDDGSGLYIAFKNS